MRLRGGAEVKYKTVLFPLHVRSVTQSHHYTQGAHSLSQVLRCALSTGKGDPQGVNDWDRA